METKIDSKIAIPKGKWVRLEGYAQIDTNGHNGIARLYQDGQLIAELNNLDLGGARYGWKLHGFMGTWMWGGAGDKYVSAKTETFYIKNMRIYDDPPTGDEAVAATDHSTDVDSAKAAFGEAAVHDKSDPDDATDPPLIVTADAQGTPDYMSATAATETATTAAKTDTAHTAETEEGAAAAAAATTDATADATAEGQQQEAAAGSEAALQAALLAAEATENAQAPSADDANAAVPAAETVAAATTETAPETAATAAVATTAATSEGELAQVLIPTHDPAAFVHIA